MIIVCPNCDARYQVASSSLGNAGRKVQCANCRSDWTAQPEPEQEAVELQIVEEAPSLESDQLFDEEGEKKLDEAFEQEQSRVDKLAHELADGASKDPSEADEEKFAAHRTNLLRRQQLLIRNLPRARMRRAGRMVVGIALMTLIGAGFFSRDLIVRSLPDTAWLYSAIGLSVNVTGLEFNNIQTIRAVTDGVEQIEITGEIQNVSGGQVAVPSIQVRLIDVDGNSIYGWATQTRERVLGAREWISFSSKLSAPPAEADGIRLSFIDEAAADRSVLANDEPSSLMDQLTH